MKNKQLTFIKKIELFSGLDDQSLEALLSSFSALELKENSTLFSQGEKADALYIVVSGHLLAILEKETGHKETIGRISPGDIIGEMGLLTKKPRLLTVKTLTEVSLLKLSAADFNHFIKVNPGVLYQILVSTINRSQNTMGILAKKHTNITRHSAILPTHCRVNIKSFTQIIKQTIIESGSPIYLLDTEEINKAYEAGMNEFINHLDKIELNYHFLVYELTEDCHKGAIQIISQRLNLILMVGDGGVSPCFSDFTLQILKKEELLNITRVLTLIWSKDATIRDTRFWLKAVEFKLHYHILEGDTKSYQRLLRLFQGKLVGLVLGGGGVRSWAHLGVLKALEEKNIPVDAIGGTSAGAGIAAAYLTLGNTPALYDAVKLAADQLRKSASWSSLTLPVISFSSGIPTFKTAKHIFQDQRIEDLSIPYFAVSSNVSINSEVAISSGYLWRATISSSSIPFLFPPVLKNGELLYDGGLVNNLPVDHMRHLLGENAIVIASDLATSAPDEKRYNFPTLLSPLQILLSKLGLTKHRYQYPAFFDTAIKAMLLGSFSHYQANVKLATYYIHPDFSQYPSIFTDQYQPEDLIALGYEQALAILNSSE